MKYVYLIGFIISCVVWFIIFIKQIRGQDNMLIPMWIAVALIWIFNVGMKNYQY